VNARLQKIHLIPQINRYKATLFSKSYAFCYRMVTRIMLTLGLALSMVWTALVGYALVQLVRILF